MSWHHAPGTRRRGGRVVASVFGIIALGLIVIAGALFLWGRSELDARDPDHSHTVTLSVHSGESLDDLVHDLDSNHMIKSTTWFTWYARYKGLGDTLHTGRYTLDGGMAASAIVARLEQLPDVRATRVVLAEGLTAQQMAAKIEAAGTGITARQYMDEVAHGTFNQPFLSNRPGGASLEGFLFPDTYDIPDGMTAHQLVLLQLQTFATKAQPVLAAAHLQLTDYQVVTVASIVEREARFAADRPLVASVIMNRLNAGMKLQVDATVSYGAGRSSGEPTADELRQDTPYNTYIHVGLPPTPISNPGIEAITAAASPAQTSYLFYVSDGCGHNHYAITAAEHNANVQRYNGKPCGS